MSRDADLIIVGAGPGGCSAAISGQLKGLKTMLIERKPFPRHRPGETLHPGVSSILQSLHVHDEIRLLSQVSPTGIHTRLGSEEAFSQYGGSPADPWIGFQVLGEEFDQALLDRYLSLGGTYLCPEKAVGPLLAQGRVVGVRTSTATLHAPMVIDATGRARWLDRCLFADSVPESPRLVVSYGFREGFIGVEPTLACDSQGWKWMAQITPSLVSWTQLAYPRPPPDRLVLPIELSSLKKVGRQRSADVTWRRTKNTAGAGYFIVGDAAVILDPASSHGVLRALMSGMMATHSVLEVLAGEIDARTVARRYIGWMDDWFDHDKRALRQLYARAGITWLGETAPA